jgi:hypothetical protein
MGSQSGAEAQRQDDLDRERATVGKPEVLPALHPNLAQVYRRKVEALEQELAEPLVAAAAAAALRSLIDAIIIHPGDHRGETSIELRGDLAAFMHCQTVRTTRQAKRLPPQGTAVLVL